MPDKLTDKEIVKALECCRQDDYDYCEECPYRKNKPCQENLIQDCFDLINRLQAENERLKNKLEPQGFKEADPMDFCGVLCDFSEKLIAKAKAEAYKECLEKVEQRDVSESDFYIMVKKTEFDNLLKELIGE